MLSTLKGRRILVAEDEYFIADDVAAALRRAGAEVIGPVGGLAGALQALDEHWPVDAAVIDVNLHGEMIFPLAERLGWLDVPFVFVTGYDSTVIPSTFRRVPRLEKPFNCEALVRALPALFRATLGDRLRGLLMRQASAGGPAERP